MQIDETNVLESKTSINRADLTTLQSLPTSTRGESSPLASELAYWLTTPEITRNVVASSAPSTREVEQKSRENGGTSSDLVNVQTFFLGEELLQSQETVANSIKKEVASNDVYDPTSLEKQQRSQEGDSDDDNSYEPHSPISVDSKQTICSSSSAYSTPRDSDSDENESSDSGPTSSERLQLSCDGNSDVEFTESKNSISVEIERGSCSNKSEFSTAKYSDVECISAQAPSTDLLQNTKVEFAAESVANPLQDTIAKTNEIDPYIVEILTTPESSESEFQPNDVKLLSEIEEIKCQDESDTSESSSTESEYSSDGTSTSDQSDTATSTSSTQPTGNNTSDNETEKIEHQEDNIQQPEKIEYQGDNIEQSKKIEYQEDNIQQPEKIEYQGNNIQQPEQIEYQGDIIQQPEKIEYQGNNIQQPEQIEYQGDIIQQPEKIEYQGNNIQQPEQIEYQGNNIQQPEQIEYQGNNIQQPEQIEYQGDNIEPSEPVLYTDLYPSQQQTFAQARNILEIIANEVDSNNTFNGNAVYQKGECISEEYTEISYIEGSDSKLAFSTPNFSELPLNYESKYEFSVKVVHFEEPIAPEQTLVALNDPTVSEVDNPPLFTIQSVESLAGFPSETLNADTIEQQRLQQRLFWHLNGGDTQTATSFSEDFAAVPHFPSNLPTSIAINAAEPVSVAESEPSVQPTPIPESIAATEQLNPAVPEQAGLSIENCTPEVEVEEAPQIPEPPRLLPSGIWPYLIDQQKERVIHELSVYENLLLQHENQLKYQQSLQPDGDQVDLDLKRLNEAEVFVWLQHQSENKSDINSTAADQAAQMGIEKWFSTLRNLIFSRNTNTTDTTEDNTLSSGKKRRSVHLKSSEQYHPIKYRRVDNTFPKIINTPPTSDLNDDGYMPSGISYYPMSKQNFLPRHSTASNSEIANRTKLRNSFPAATQNVRRSFQNQNICEIDLSDDDDDLYTKVVEQNIRGNNVKCGNGSVGLNVAVNGDCLKPGKVYNVHVERTGVNERVAPPPPPPLLVADGNDWLAAPFQQRISHGNMNHTDYLRCSSSLSSQDTPTLGSGRTNNNWSLAPLRVVPQRREIIERAQYMRLLQQYEPRVYGGQEDELTQRYVNRRSSQLGKQQRISDIGRPLVANNSCFGTLPPPPLSSTINLDDIDDEMPDVRKFVIEVDGYDDDEDIDDIENVENVVQHMTAKSPRANKGNVHDARAQQQHKQKQRAQDTSECVATVDLVDDDFDDIIDLSGFDEPFECDEDVIIAEQPEQNTTNNDNSLIIEPVNSLEARLQSCALMKANWSTDFAQKWNRIYENKVQDVKFLEEQISLVAAEREKKSHEALTRRLKSIQFNDRPYIGADDLESADEKQEKLLPLTAEHRNQLQRYLDSPSTKVLVSKFNLNITREDIVTLLGINWLNDEVINFYMNLLTERSEQKPDGLRVYAMNTFFVPRLLQGGHGAVRRWTRKVDIFSKDVIPVPVHVGGVHWCMAVIHLKEKNIKYYDSMGKPNSGVLRALEMYLQEESLDKRKIPFDTSGFRIESVADSPRQSNGSDCGVFSCMTAEYITRGRPITFSQANMEYFRHKMILEIVGGKLWH